MVPRRPLRHKVQYVQIASVPPVYLISLPPLDLRHRPIIDPPCVKVVKQARGADDANKQDACPVEVLWRHRCVIGPETPEE